jgi:hypothetical protein
MSWYQIDIDDIQMSAKELRIVKQKFIDLWHNSGCPKDMTLLCDTLPEPGKERYGAKISIYLSPVSSQFASKLIFDYKGTLCEQPSVDNVAFLAGDVRLFSSLLDSSD